MRNAPTAYLLTCAAIGVATGLLTVPATAFSTAFSPIAPPVAALAYGAWSIGFVVALRLLERPGAGVLTGLLSGLVAMPLSATGPAIVVTNVMYALLLELPFLLMLYRRWYRWMYYAGTAIVATLYAVWSVLAADMQAFAPWVLAAFVGVAIASPLVGTWLGILIADRLARAGVARTARRRPATSVPG